MDLVNFINTAFDIAAAIFVVVYCATEYIKGKAARRDDDKRR